MKKIQSSLPNDDERVDTLENIAMGIILNAGDARTELCKALDAALDENFQAAHGYLEKAMEFIHVAHDLQTGIITREASGVGKLTPSFLFIHAQDTLMTIKSEVYMMKDMIKMYKKIVERKGGTE